MHNNGDIANVEEEKKEEVEIKIIQKQEEPVEEEKENQSQLTEEQMGELKKGKAALDSITKASLVEIKAYKNPPEKVKLTLQIICVFLGHKQNWDSCKKLLTDTTALLRALANFDKDHIPRKVIKIV